MAQFNLTWDNTDVLAAGANNLQQRASYRKKITGGAWITTGFTPANDLANSATSVQSPVLDSNVIYEFKMESLCTQNGPVLNNNGIREQIGFSPISPITSKTDKTASIQLDLTNTDISKVRFTLKKSSDNSIVYGPLMIAREGNSAVAVASGLVGGTTYYWEVAYIAIVNGNEVVSQSVSYNGAAFGPYSFTTDTPVQNLVWVADQKVCEKQGGFGTLSTITGLSSPTNMWFDATLNKTFVADHDAPSGNVYWFNPTTATVASDVTYSTKVIKNKLYNSYIDTQYRRIYFVGGDSGGLIVYDIDTDSATTVAFGTDGDFTRVLLSVSGNDIYCNIGSTSIVKISRSALTISSTIAISSIPSPDHFLGDFTFIPVGAKLYVINQNNPNVGTIGVYNAALTTLLAEIALPGATTWSNSAYWQTGFYDEVSKRLYVGEVGSSSRHVIDVDPLNTSTVDTVINTQIINNRSGKSNAYPSWTINPNTNELVFINSFYNNSSDSTPITRTYIENRAGYTYKRMYKNQTYLKLFAYPGTNKLFGVNRGKMYWYSPNTGYNTDGSIQILSNSVGTGNTGVQITNTLKQVDANNANTPTGLTKSNVPSDPDYIPPSTDTGSCPITYTTDCPTDLVTTYTTGTGKLEFELSLPEQVRANSAIAKVQIWAFNTNSNGVEGSPIEKLAPLTDYYSGEFTGLGGLNYSIRIKYFNSSNVELQSC